MSGGSQEVIDSLREALAATPQNVPLRKHLADTLRMYGQLADAEQEYRRALQIAPDRHDLKQGLAQTYLQQGAHSKALVVLEDIVKSGAATAPMRVLFARALLADGKADRAAHHYREAVASDASVADPSLAEELGVEWPPRRAGDEEVDDQGRVRMRAGDSGAGSGNLAFAERPDISFADVGGMEKVKDEIRMKIIHPITHRDLYKSYGKAVGGGILMYGPPGCGKTHLARATAGEVQARFLVIGISEVLSMWLGESERQLHDLFEKARAHAPCVLFFDEVDALGASRSDMRQSAGRHLVNQFLNEMDGMASRNEGVLILAATNAPWHVDPAFRRPGRFDRILFVPPPDVAARAQIIRILLKGKPVDGADADALAKKTEGFSGADLKSLIDIAVEEKLREAISKGGVQPLRTKDLLAAAKSVRISTREWFATARNHALYANEGGLYDDVLEYIKRR